MTQGIDTSLLANGDFSNWVEGLVVLIVIGLSTLSGVANWLIRKYRGDSADGSAKPGQPVQRRGGPRPRSPFPTAEPLDRPLPRRPTGSPVASPFSPPQPPQPIPPFAAPVGSAPQTPPARPRPVRRSIAHPPAPPPMRPPVAHSAPAATERARQPAKTGRKPTPERSKKARQPDPMAEQARPPEHHPPAIRTEVPERAQAQPAELGDPLALLRTPTRRALRQAIIMKEVLGPPIALRPPGMDIL